MTNFERIKTMNKAEMAEFIDDVSVGEYDFFTRDCNGGITEWLDWLEWDCESTFGVDYRIVQQQQDFMRMVQEADYEIC